MLSKNSISKDSELLMKFQRQQIAAEKAERNAHELRMNLVENERMALAKVHALQAEIDQQAAFFKKEEERYE